MQWTLSGSPDILNVLMHEHMHQFACWFCTCMHTMCLLFGWFIFIFASHFHTIGLLYLDLLMQRFTSLHQVAVIFLCSTCKLYCINNVAVVYLLWILSVTIAMSCPVHVHMDMYCTYMYVQVYSRYTCTLNTLNNSFGTALDTECICRLKDEC